MIAGIGKKTLRLLRLFCTSPLALALVLSSRLLRPLIRIRFGALKSDRIGHFVIETELMLQEQRAGIAPVPPRSIDIYYAPGPVSNSQVEKMWRRVINLGPRWLMIPAFRFNKIVPGASSHTVPYASSALDVHNLLDSTEPILRFSDEEEFVGRRLLEELELERFKYVCVIARDTAYYRSALPELDLPYHDYRNCRIESYLSGLDALTREGLRVLRMGSIVASKLETTNPMIFDYANSRFRTDFADVYLAANCKFCISDGLGFFALPAAFRRPNAFVNFAPFHMFYSSRETDVGIAKVFADRETGRIIPLRELQGLNIAYLTRSELINSAGLKVVDNSAEEIRQLLVEMNQRMDGRWVGEPQDDMLQESFWDMFKAVIGREGKRSHGEFRSRYGANYLRDHIDWFSK